MINSNIRSQCQVWFPRCSRFSSADVVVNTFGPTSHNSWFLWRMEVPVGEGTTWMWCWAETSCATGGVYISNSSQIQQNKVVDVGGGGQNTSTSLYVFHSSRCCVSRLVASDVIAQTWLNIDLTTECQLPAVTLSGMKMSFNLSKWNNQLKSSPLPAADQSEPGQQDAEQRELLPEP